jgi:hypothetical protein
LKVESSERRRIRITQRRPDPVGVNAERRGFAERTSRKEKKFGQEKTCLEGGRERG